MHRRILLLIDHLSYGCLTLFSLLEYEFEVAGGNWGCRSERRRWMAQFVFRCKHRGAMIMIVNCGSIIMAADATKIEMFYHQ